MKNRILCVLVSLCMAATMFPMSAFADNITSSENAVARIGDTNYLSLSDAINDVKDGETITLLKDWKKAVVIGDKKPVDFTFDLNGNRILVDNAIDAVAVYGGHVVIKNGIIDNTYKTSSMTEEFHTALYTAAEVELYNMELNSTDAYSSTCYVEDNAALVIDDSMIKIRGNGGDCITVSYEGTAVITDTEIMGSEYPDTTSFYKEQYGVIAYGDVALKNVNIKRIENGIYLESKKAVSVTACNISEVDTAVFLYNSTGVTVDGGVYSAKTHAFYAENSKAVIGESTWSLKGSLDAAFFGAEYVTLKPDVSPSLKEWKDESVVKFYKVLAKSSLSKTASYGAKAVKVVWTDVPGAAKYEIYRSIKPSSGYTRIKTVNDVENKETYSFINTGRTRYKTYYYKVKAIGYNPKVTSVSAYKKVKVNIATPKLNISNYSDNFISHKYKMIPGANGYEFYCKIGKNGKWKLKDSIDFQEEWYIYPYEFGKTYYIKMRAYDKVDGKKYYSSFSNVVKYYHNPPAIKNLKGVNASGKAKLTWDKEIKISGYDIYRSTKKGGTYSKVKTIKGASNKTYIDKNVKTGKTYYYKVRSYATVKGKTIPGKFSSIVKITF